MSKGFRARNLLAFRYPTPDSVLFLMSVKIPYEIPPQTWAQFMAEPNVQTCNTFGRIEMRIALQALGAEVQTFFK